MNQSVIVDKNTEVKCSLCHEKFRLEAFEFFKRLSIQQKRQLEEYTRLINYGDDSNFYQHNIFLMI